MEACPLTPAEDRAQIPGSASSALTCSVLLSAAALLSLAALVLYLTGLVKASRGDYGFHPAIWFVLLGASAGLLGSYLQNSGNMFASIAGLISVLFDLLAVRCVICTADEAIGFGARKFLIPILILYALMLLLTLASAVLELTGYIQSYSYWIGLITSFLALISTAYYASALITARKK